MIHESRSYPEGVEYKDYQYYYRNEDCFAPVVADSQEELYDFPDAEYSDSDQNQHRKLETSQRLQVIVYEESKSIGRSLERYEPDALRREEEKEVGESYKVIVD